MSPLDGIRVLDLTRVVAGPLCTRILADLGAEVIKIETPDGDLSRTFPPIDEDHNTPYFAQQNAGKRFCSVDLRAPGATELMIELAATCDVVVENFRPGVMARYGLGPDELCSRFPRLVYCSITGFGQTGPWADRRAYAPVGHLESGLLEYDERKTGQQAHQPALVIGDSVTAMLAASAVNAMLLQAHRTGVGGRLDVCMVESLVYMQEWVATELAGGAPASNPAASEQCPILHLSDGRTWGLAGNPVTWFDQLVSVMQRPDLADDPRFAEIDSREQHRSALVEIIAQWAVSFTEFDEFRATLEAGSPFTVAELRSIHELIETDFARHRGLITKTDSGIDIPDHPVRGPGIGTNGHVAHRGADNRSTFTDVLGLDDERLDSLTAAGILVAHN